jgi:hypothetical protein
MRPWQLLGEHALRLSAVTTSEVTTESAWRGQSARDVLQGELVVHGDSASSWCSPMTAAA